MKQIGKTLIIAALALHTVWLATADATPIQLVANSVNIFRDTRGANDVGLAQGDRIQFGANIVGGSLGTTLGATYGPTGFTVSQNPCDPISANLNFCARTTAFNANRLQPWSLRFENGPDSLTVASQSLAGAEQPVPFPVNVSFAGNGTTPTISWNVPNNFVPDGFRVNILDKNRISPVDGSADIVHSVAISETATSYSLPSVFSSGLPLQLGGNYVINLQMIETRNHVNFTNNNAQILRRSSSFFDFTPTVGTNVPLVALPTVVNGVYNFNVTNVGPSSVTFIDPLIAIGYKYATGDGDPNFASVLLPNVGDGEYVLSYLINGQLVQIPLDHDVQFFFPQGGVSAFDVTGIETAANLDPNNVTAFITGLTFVANGTFTGTMTPITLEVPETGRVPEPSVILLMIIGGALLARSRGKHKFWL